MEKRHCTEETENIGVAYIFLLNAELIKKILSQVTANHFSSLITLKSGDKLGNGHLAFGPLDTYTHKNAINDGVINFHL